MKKLFVLASVGVLLLAPAAQVFAMGTSNSQTKTVTVDKTVTRDEVKSDSDITKAVKNALAADNNFATQSLNVHVATVNGVVTLSGFVDSNDAKTDFETKAKEVAGVTKVINNIEVRASVTK